jgi:antitoxin Phd
MTTVVTGPGIMRDIQLKTAKATLSSLIDETGRGEAFAITRHGRKEAVVISWEAWQRLSNVPTFGRLLASSPIQDGDLPERNSIPARDADL